jgi:energy-converting hydrogenase Eha subunit G
MTAPTPTFFRKVRTIGLILAAVSATILATPIALPALVVQVAGYLAVAGSVATAVAQTATEDTVRGDTNHGDSDKPINEEYYGYEHKP